MNHHHHFMMTACAVLLLLLLSVAASTAQITVTIPSVVAKAGMTKVFAVNVGDLTGSNVTSFDLSITGNSAIAKFDSVIVTDSTKLKGMMYSSNVTNGQVNVSAAASTPLAGSGTLLYISATMIAPGTADLTVTLNFNDGTPGTTYTNPHPALIVPELAVMLPEMAFSDSVSAVRSVPLTTEDITGKGVVSYDCTISYDPQYIQITGVDGVGTMSSGMNIVANTSEPGLLIISAAGTMPLTGAGTLVNLRTKVLKGGVTPLTFESFQFNDGTPAAGSVDGKLNIGINGIVERTNPSEFRLFEAFPNPFNPTTNLSFSLPKESSVTLEIFNILGMRVRTLAAGMRMGSGYHTMTWNGRDDAGNTLPSGMYIYRISAGSYTASKKMMMMK